MLGLGLAALGGLVGPAVALGAAAGALVGLPRQRAALRAWERRTGQVALVGAREPGPVLGRPGRAGLYRAAAQSSARSATPVVGDEASAGLSSP